jgi:hypothetical protein
MGKLAITGILINILLTLGATSICEAQEVEHNYQVGPQNATCDSLKIQKLNSEQAMEQIRGTKFRVQQSFKLPRREGFKGGEFYSCDGDTGFLIIKYSQSVFLFTDVDKEIWKNLKTSQDPEGYFLEIKEGLQNID